jgi:hypothetical protein
VASACSRYTSQHLTGGKENPEPFSRSAAPLMWIEADSVESLLLSDVLAGATLGLASPMRKHPEIERDCGEAQILTKTSPSPFTYNSHRQLLPHCVPRSTARPDRWGWEDKRPNDDIFKSLSLGIHHVLGPIFFSRQPRHCAVSSSSILISDASEMSSQSSKWILL